MTEDQNMQTDATGFDSPAASSEMNVLHHIHALLRGRYPWVIGLALLGAVAGAALGYRAIALEYRSMGAVQVRTHAPRILFDLDTGGPNSSAKRVEAYAQFMRSRRLADMAMQREEWQTLARGLTPAAQNAFINALQVQHRSGSEFITVVFTDVDPAAARAGVQATIGAFMRLVQERQLKEDTERLRLLQGRESSLATQLNSIESSIEKVGTEIGVEGLQQAYRSRLMELGKLEGALAETQIALAAARKRHEEIAVGVVDPKAPTSPRLESYRQQRDRLQLQINQYRDRFGENHRGLKEALGELKLLDAMIQHEAARLEPGYAAQDGQTPGVAPEIAMLEERLAAIERQREATREEVAQLSARDQQLESLRQEARVVREKLTETSRRIEQLNFEASAAGAVEAISTGDPAEPSNYAQKAQFAVLGGVAGAALGVGVVLLLGLARPQLRHLGEVSLDGQGLRMLGMLPTLPEEMGDPNSPDAMLAGQCLHHIRTVLQLDHVDRGRRALLITGPASGTGKTSLTLALGVSFASAGTRTVLVDFDLTGGGLTHRLGAVRRRRLGELLRWQGLIDETQLQAALADPANAEKRLGEVLVAHGMIGQDQLERTLALQPGATIGVLDALSGEPLDRCTLATGIPNLSIVPAGAASGRDSNRLSPQAVRKLIKSLREQYDAVLIDSGPAPGSLETPIVSAAADGVVLVVSRGDRRGSLGECAEIVRSVGATLVGMVFNRAEPRDLERSPYSRSQNRSSTSLTGTGGSERRFGSIVETVIDHENSRGA